MLVYLNLINGIWLLFNVSSTAVLDLVAIVHPAFSISLMLSIVFCDQYDINQRRAASRNNE